MDFHRRNRAQPRRLGQAADSDFRHAPCSSRCWRHAGERNEASKEA